MDKPIDGIMEDLRREVHKYVLVPRDETPISAESLSLAQLRQRQVVNSHLPIGWPTMPKNIVQKVIAYAQKIIRRLLRWYINPIVGQQNSFNDAVVTAIAEQGKSLKVLEQTVADLQAEVAEIARVLERIEWRQGERVRRQENGTEMLQQRAQLEDD